MEKYEYSKSILYRVLKNSSEFTDKERLNLLNTVNEVITFYDKIEFAKIENEAQIAFDKAYENSNNYGTFYTELQHVTTKLITDYLTDILKLVENLQKKNKDNDKQQIINHLRELMQ